MMKILAIETSCDETAISILQATGGLKNPKFEILADTVISQINLHKKYGGVFPSLAKREHTKNLLPVLVKTLKKAKLLIPIDRKKKLTAFSLQFSEEKIKKILEREREIGLAEELISFVKNIKIPEIDAVAVTQGPGLEPALWTGLNFAKALSLIWNKSFIPVNHMEGHLVAFFAKQKKRQSQQLQPPIANHQKIEFPALGLLLSGGHTELILTKKIGKYKTIGQTRDDAVGEAYDKVARMMNLPYPGGPEISKLSEQFVGHPTSYKLPRPMLNSPDFDFSFSGLKTAVLYTIKNILKSHTTKLTLKIKKEISYEFENAVIDVLLYKTKKAIEKYKIKTLILGGGVTANNKIRKSFQNLESEKLNVLTPEIDYSTDNAVMIGIAGYFRYLDEQYFDPNKTEKIKASGNLRL